MSMIYPLLVVFTQSKEDVLDVIASRDGKAIVQDSELHPIVMKHQAEVEQKYVEGKCKLATFTKWCEVNSSAAEKMFPNWRYAAVRWDEKRNPKWKKPVSLAARLSKTLVIDAKRKKIVAELYGWGNYEAFGKLIVDRRVKIKDAKQARLVWTAFCELHRKFSPTAKIERASDNEWRLGISSYDQTVASSTKAKTVVTRTHYTRVTTDPKTSRMLTWKSIVETSNKREVAIDR
ncbi:MAG: hypothetical protein CMJ78_08460 [Planctomycetaceae bacterium]|nr:hypothetical protein [Planctomycetaceae bacterium]